MTIKPLAKWLAFRTRTRPITGIILHATAGGTLAGALSTLRLRGLSYHFLIDKNGEITKACPYTKVAFHAGKSEGPDGPNCNGHTIGISMVNRNDGKDPYPQAQVAACVDLCKELAASVPTLKWLACHYSVSPGRKTDPKGFPAKLVAVECGLSAWRVAL